MSEKHTFTYIKNFIEVERKEGFKLLSTEYKGNKVPLEIICSKGHTFNANFNNLSTSKSNCPYCSGKAHYKYEEVYDMFKNENCILLSTEYNNDNREKLKYQCSCGNIDEISLTNFLAGHRCNICGQEKRIETNLERYGVKYTSQNKEVRAKQLDSLFTNGTQKTSSQQSYLYNLLGGELNYPVSRCSLDIAYPNEMIYLEYDGGFHNGKVICGIITQEEFNKNERKRSCILSDFGWKEIRIISISDKLPTDEIILKMISEAKDYLNQGHHYIKFDIDNSTTINSQGVLLYDFGLLRKITKDSLIDKKDLSESVINNTINIEEAI